MSAKSLYVNIALTPAEGDVVAHVSKFNPSTGVVLQTLTLDEAFPKTGVVHIKRGKYAHVGNLVLVRGAWRALANSTTPLSEIVQHSGELLDKDGKVLPLEVARAVANPRKYFTHWRPIATDILVK